MTIDHCHVQDDHCLPFESIESLCNLTAEEVVSIREIGAQLTVRLGFGSQVEVVAIVAVVIQVVHRSLRRRVGLKVIVTFSGTQCQVVNTNNASVKTSCDESNGLLISGLTMDLNAKDFRSVPPPQDINKRQTYSKCNEISSKYDYNYVNRRQRLRTDDDYFDEDNDDCSSTQNDYIPKPGSPSAMTRNSSQNEQNDDSEEDPLDAFMASLEDKSKGSKPSQSVPQMSDKHISKTTTAVRPSEIKGIRYDIEGEDQEESYYKYMEENPNAGVGTLALGSEDETEADDIEYDADGNPIGVLNPKMIDPLPLVYHSQITYSPFERNFYVEHKDITELSESDCNQLRQKLGIKVSGLRPPKPVTSFAHFGFDDQLMKVIRKLEYTQPTPIQALAVPTALSGRDIIGIAKTGSGKTAAFIWPLLIHIMDQPELKPGDGPIGVVLAPTRELAQQIYTEAKKFAKVYNINIVCAYGGGNKYEQSKDLEAGAEVVVATPVSCLLLLLASESPLCHCRVD